MLRLSFSMILLLLSLLVVVRAPLNMLWLVAVAITCYPYIGMGLSTLSFILGCQAEKYRVTILLFSAVAFTLYTLPVTIAYQKGRKIAGEITRVFPDAVAGNALRQPFTWSDMFTGIGIQPVQPQTIVYHTLPDQALSLDFYPSYKKELSPVVIVIHGGSWESGDSRQLPELNSYLANRGYHVAAINYRLAPAHRFPAPVEDVNTVISYLTLHADSLRIDTRRIVLLGRSAGAQIALIAAYSLHNPNIKGVIDYYGPADMIWGGQVKVSNLVLNTGRIYNNYFGGVYQQVPQIFKAASACEYVNATSPPTLLIHGTTDPLVSYTHSVHLQEKLNAAHVKNYFLSLPYATHGCDFNISGPSGQLATFATVSFIYSVTR